MRDGRSGAGAEPRPSPSTRTCVCGRAFPRVPPALFINVYELARPAPVRYFACRVAPGGLAGGGPERASAVTDSIWRRRWRSKAEETTHLHERPGGAASQLARREALSHLERRLRVSGGTGEHRVGLAGRGGRPGRPGTCGPTGSIARCPCLRGSTRSWSAMWPRVFAPASSEPSRPSWSRVFFSRGPCLAERRPRSGAGGADPGRAELPSLPRVRRCAHGPAAREGGQASIVARAAGPLTRRRRHRRRDPRANGAAGYDPHYFAKLPQVEGTHFWYVHRRETILSALRAEGSRPVPAAAVRRRLRKRGSPGLARAARDSRRGGLRCLS